MTREQLNYPCPKCHEQSLDPLECTRCGVIFAKFREAEMRPSRITDTGATSGRFDELPVAVRVALLPALLGLSWLLIQVPLFQTLAWTFGSIPFHEIGHAVFAWLGGRKAFPIGAVVPFASFTTWSNERSYLLALIFQGLAGWGTLKLWRGGFVMPALALGAFLLTMLRMTYVMPFEQTEKYAILGGIVGEFAVTGTVILLFFYRLPERLRWDFFRFIALPPACLGLVSSFKMWAAISAGTQPLPRGSMLVGRSDSNGDIDRLINLHGWTETGLISFMTQLRWAVLGLIAAHYLYGLVRPHDHNAPR